MTGQVKEDIISRNIELGSDVQRGCFTINPMMLEKSEFKCDGTLSFSRFGTAIHYQLHDGADIMISVNGGEYRKKNMLTRKESMNLFSRNGEIKEINIMIPSSMVI